jgi:hypothetical protein
VSPRPVPSRLRSATTLRAATHRSRVATTVTVVATGSQGDGSGPPGFRCTVDDGTAQVDLLFVGRVRVPGIEVGARCRIEGTARVQGGRLTIWNPIYELIEGGHGQQG